MSTSGNYVWSYSLLDDGTRIKVGIKANTETGWVAWGINSAEAMVGTDTVIIWREGSTTRAQVRIYPISSFARLLIKLSGNDN